MCAKCRRTTTTLSIPQKPGDRYHLNTALDKTSPTTKPMLASSKYCVYVEVGLVQLAPSAITTAPSQHTHTRTKR